jgi:hypothetical protein
MIWPSSSTRDEIVTQIEQLNSTLSRLVEVEGERRDIENQILDALRELLAQPVGFRITETALNRTGDKIMAPISKATTDLQILDDGKGVLYTLTPVNKAGASEPLPSGTVITASSSAPASLANAIPDPGDPTANPPRPPDTTGLVFLATVPQPPVDATDAVMTFSAPFGSTAAPGVDVTADNSPVGFTITETAL